MYAIPHPLLVELPDDAISSLYTDGVNVINMTRVVCFYWDYDVIQATESFVVVLGMFPSELIATLKVAQLYLQARALNRVHSAIPANHRVVIFSHLPVIAQTPNLIAKLRVVRHYGTGFAECTEVLAR